MKKSKPAFKPFLQELISQVRQKGHWEESEILSWIPAIGSNATFSNESSVK